MKRAVLTQRVEIDPAYGERRDALDQRWHGWLVERGYLGVALPNTGAAEADALLGSLQPDVVILTGGNTPTGLDPDAGDAAPERDRLERRLLEAALDRDIPVLGVCRGMQMINLHFGGGGGRVDRHAGTRHLVRGLGPEPVEVNSYHHWGLRPDDLAGELEALAWDQQGHVEALRHRTARIGGLMWHPERERSGATPGLDLVAPWL